MVPAGGVIRIAAPAGASNLFVNVVIEFVGLDPNDYIIVFSLPSGLIFTVQNTPDVEAASDDNDADATGETGIFSVDYDETETSVGAGYYDTEPTVSVMSLRISWRRSSITGCTASATPDSEPDEALRAIADAAPLDSPVLVVSHLPLVGRLTQELIGDDPGFSPGTFVEIVREGDGPARLLRRVGPRDLEGR